MSKKEVLYYSFDIKRNITGRIHNECAKLLALRALVPHALQAPVPCDPSHLL